MTVFHRLNYRIFEDGYLTHSNSTCSWYAEAHDNIDVKKDDLNVVENGKTHYEGPTNANRIANDESELDSELFDNDSNSVATSDSEISDDDDSDVDASWNVKSFTIDEESIGENQLNSKITQEVQCIDQPVI
ncbi:hypothetical protein WR25_00598 [Diploscapter pachys]|uniref:Uncharacterized protein n=1 Tax=Diploscapter pachys TaxID=2018661 RepID=A0A2A2KI42_9BILA|nr:hypothetical protein WR25_00598 [Diploscapter pachys]